MDPTLRQELEKILIRYEKKLLRLPFIKRSSLDGVRHKIMAYDSSNFSSSPDYLKNLFERACIEESLEKISKILDRSPKFILFFSLCKLGSWLFVEAHVPLILKRDFHEIKDIALGKNLEDLKEAYDKCWELFDKICDSYIKLMPLLAILISFSSLALGILNLILRLFFS